MMMTDEEKRWLVVGIAMKKVAAPVLRDYIEQGMKTHYTKLDTYCSGLTTPCTLKGLTHLQVSAEPNLKTLKFQNINNNLHLHGKSTRRYNYSVNNSVDLAKLYLPDYLAKFTAFDESLDMSAMLRLLGFSHPTSCTPIFPSPNPLNSIQSSADDVRENVRNKWGHCNVTDWTVVFFDNCFFKLETLVKSLGLPGGKEKTVLDQLSDWQTKGCQLCMGHAVDQQLLSMVQQDVKELIKNYANIEAEQSTIREALAQQETEQMEMQDTIAFLQDKQSLTQVRLQEHEEQQMKENKEILAKLQFVEKSLKEELLMRFQEVEERFAESDEKVEQLQAGLGETDDKVEKLQCDVFETGDKVKQLELEFRGQNMKANVADPSPVELFDVKTCRGKLTEHYKRTATVPTSVWSKKCPVNIHQIYTRLSWVKEEQTPAGSSQSELIHYTDVFNENEEGLVPNRILVQGQTGIGKSTFVKKLALDWAELNDKRTVDKQQDVKARCEVDGSVSQNCEDSSREDHVDVSENETKALKRFELVLVVNLKEVSKCQSLKDVICGCNLFPEEDTAMTEQLLSYITKNQQKVLLVFDGYDEYRCGINSEIYEIFTCKKLRNCCVLVTTRISKADDLREFKDVHAEITGFSEEDSEVFASRILGSKTEAMELMDHLFEKKLIDLAKVPLLVLFFCTLWKKGKLKSFPETKSKLYYAIVQYVLDHNQGKRSPGHFGKVEDYKEILVEIGKVALECLLKDDHVFEFDQLSTSILCEESGFIGLLQVSEYTENLRPAGMVSFIHKSIQEFLAAWYITYRCVPGGDLGEMKEYARTLEDFLVLENVFQFICGLSDNGAVKVFEHLASVRISNPELDLSKTILDVTSEMYIPLSDMYITSAQVKFSELVYNCFQEVQSKPQLLNHCFDCTGGIVLVTRQLTELLKKTKVKNVTEFIRSDVVFPVLNNNEETYQILYELVDILKCLHIPLRITETESFTLGDFLMNLQKYWSSCHFRFTSILCFRNDQFQFYVTSLKLCCDNISRLFTGATAFSVQSGPTEWCLEQFCYKFLRSLKCGVMVNSSILKALGVVIRNCKYLNSIIIEKAEGCICDILESVPNPSKCTLKIGGRFGRQCTLLPSEVEKLATLLPRFNNILRLNLSLSFSCAETFVASVTHETLEELVLDEISLTPAAAAMLGRSLPEMSSLKNLTLSGGILSLQMEALFGGFNKPLPLRQLRFSDFSIRGCLAPLSNSLRFFFNLHYLELTDVNWNEHNLLHLLKSLEFIPNLETLMVVGERQSHSESCLESCSEEVDIQTSFTHNTLRTLEMRQISLTPPAAAALGRLLPEMSALERLVLTRRDGSTLQALEMGALFGGFNKTLPLQHLTFTGFSVRDCLSPLAESFRFFPNLQKPYLDIDFFIDGNNFPGFLESLRFIPCFRALIVNCKAMTRAGCTEEEQTASSLKTGCTPFSESNLYLNEISLTPVAAAALGRSLAEMSSLRTLKLTGKDGSILNTEEMEALFGGLNTTLPLRRFYFSGFSVRGCLAPLTNSLQFLPSLQYLTLTMLNLDEHDLYGLLKSFGFISDLTKLDLSHNPLGHAVTSIVPHVLNGLPRLLVVDLRQTASEEDLKCLQERVKQARPRLDVCID